MTELHVIALSGGKDSTAMALRLAELHPEREFVRLITPTGNELPELLRKIIAGAELLMFLKRSRRIRIIYITEELQDVGLYCCSLRIAESAGWGVTQPKVLNLNQSLKSRLAWLVCGVRKTECVGAS